jgi:hypothetical protein
MEERLEFILSPVGRDRRDDLIKIQVDKELWLLGCPRSEPITLLGEQDARRIVR